MVTLKNVGRGMAQALPPCPASLVPCPDVVETALDPAPLPTPTSDSPSVASSLDARVLRKQERRTAIIDAAAKLFAEHGYTDCDMERVAAATGLAKGTLYLYFPCKQDLFFACVDWGMAAMRRAVMDAVCLPGNALERIGKSIRAYLEFFDQNPQFVELIVQERASFRGHKRVSYFEHRDEIRVFFRQLYGELVEEGVFRNDLPVERLLDSVGSHIYGVMFISDSVGRNCTFEEQYKAVMQTIFGGILSDAGRTRFQIGTSG